MRIFFEDTFDAAHWLPNVPDDHKCHNLHGHTYHVRIEIQGTVSPRTGWVIDYADIKAVWEPIKRILDHKCVNDIIPNSTCENLVEFIWDRMVCASLPPAKIEVRETAHCGAYREA